MNQVALNTFSSFDTGTSPTGEKHPERFYHGFVLGLMADKSRDYIIKSNRESGFRETLIKAFPWPDFHREAVISFENPCHPPEALRKN